MILLYLLIVVVAGIFVFLFSAAEWKLDEPDWTGRLKVSAKGHNLHIRLEDKNTGNNNNNIVSISRVQNKLSSVVIIAVQTNMSAVSRQKSVKKRPHSEGLLANCFTRDDQWLQCCV